MGIWLPSKTSSWACIDCKKEFDIKHDGTCDCGKNMLPVRYAREELIGKALKIPESYQEQNGCWNCLFGIVNRGWEDEAVYCGFAISEELRKEFNNTDYLEGRVSREGKCGEWREK